MTPEELYGAIAAAETVAAVDLAIQAFEATHAGAIQWRAFGRENNRGAVEASNDPGRSLVERITNGVDAILEAEHARHNGRPDCRTPKDAAMAWLNVPEDGLSAMGAVPRRQLAQRVTVKVLAGDGRDGRVVEVRDRGIGIRPADMPGTILSLNETNKSRKLYLAGAYGQGGSSTLAVSKVTMIASRAEGQPTVGFTVAMFYEPPPEEDKVGRYVYLTMNGNVLEAAIPDADFPVGTLVRHFGFDLSDYTSPFGVTSVYGLLNRILFDPVLPVWLDNPVNQQRRVIKGSRNALNGAVDEGDDDRRGVRLAHNVPLYTTSLGAEFGRIGLEYWALERPTQENKRPSAAFVNPTKPIVLTINGQNHAEFSAALIRKDADLSFLTQRLIVHVDCNSLTPLAKRLLFVSNREDARRGVVRKLITDEVVRALRSDDELKRLNDEARDQGMRERDERATEEIRREVSRLLRIQGLAVGQPVGDEPGDENGRPARPIRPRPPRPEPEAIELREPPTYIRLLWDGDEPITFYAEQRRYLRVETDANSNYHNARNPAASRINIIVAGDGLTSRGSTPLRGGRMRGIFEATAGAAVGQTGRVRVELSRTGLPMLSDEREYLIVPTPPARPGARQVTLPQWKIQRVENRDDSRWTDLNWPDDVNAIASFAQMEHGELVIYYSAVFPRYALLATNFERRNPALAASFTTRYEIWLAVHALLMHQDQPQTAVAPDAPDEDLEAAEARDRQERIRTAVLSTMFAAREAEQPNLALAGGIEPD
jgi:hypothetical protein